VVLSQDVKLKPRNNTNNTIRYNKSMHNHINTIAALYCLYADIEE